MHSARASSDLRWSGRRRLQLSRKVARKALSFVAIAARSARLMSGLTSGHPPVAFKWFGPGEGSPCLMPPSTIAEGSISIRVGCTPK